MFDNPVLDVGIGLIFVYVLYSLLASTVKEFLAAIYSYRGRMLERGIEQMLDGQNFRYHWWHKLYNRIIWCLHSDKLRHFRMERHDFMSNKKLDEKFRKLYPKVSRSRLDDKSDLFASEVFDHPLYKRLASGNNPGSKPAYLPADVFSTIITDLLAGEKKGPVLMKDVFAGVSSMPGIKPPTQKILTLYARKANGDLQNFQQQLEGWYNDTMDRVSGWYKKQASVVLLAIGFVLAVIFNVSTIEIVGKLSTDKSARDAMVQSASAYVQKHAGEFNTQPLSPATPVNTPPALKPVVKPDSAGIKSTNNVSPGKKAADKKLIGSAPSPVVAQTNTMHPDSAYDNALTAITKIKALYGDNIAQQNSTLGLGWGDFGYKADSLDCVNKHKPKLAAYTWYHKVGYVVGACFSIRKIIGLLLTAFAISLGAPFWFDLLNKFINLRNAGKKPDDDGGSGSSAAGNAKSLPNSFA